MAMVFVTLLATNAYALRVLWNVDIHQNKFLEGANDFHVTGTLESGPPEPPEMVAHMDGPFTDFSNTITPVGENTPFYNFTADWSDPTGGGYIPFCSWIHLGLEFDETCHNIGYWLQGWWTRDGDDPDFSPMYGFKVEDLAPQQTITIQNASDVYTELIQMDLAILPAGSPFPLEDLNAAYFAAHPEFPWMPVLITTPISMSGNGSEFTVNIEEVMGRPLGWGELLVSRQYSSYEGGSTDYFWNFEIHGAHIPEPGTIVMIALGALGVLGSMRRLRNRN
jgi:hypothetical protein